MTEGVDFEEDAFLTNRPHSAQNGQHEDSKQTAGNPQFSSAYARFNKQHAAGRGSAMERWLIRHHLAMGRRSARAILVVVILIDFVAVFLLLSHIL